MRDMGIFNGKAEYIEDNRKKVTNLSNVESPQDELEKYPSVYAVRKALGELSDDLINKTFSKAGVDEIEPQNVSFFKKSSNLYNGVNVVGRLDAKGEVDSTQTKFLTTDFIPIGLNNVGKYVCCQAKSAYNTNAHAFYDINKQFVSGYQYTRNEALPIPNRAAYFKVSVNSATSDIFVGINTDAAIMTQETYYKPYLPLSVTDYDEEATINNIVSRIVPLKPEDTTFFDASTNLFNGVTQVGRLVSNGTVDETKTGYWTSDYIYIAGNDGKYACSQLRSSGLNGYGLKFYDEFKQTLSGGNSYSFTVAYEIPVGAVYVRFSQSSNYSTSDCFIGINDTATAMTFEKYGVKIKEEYIPNVTSNWYKGKSAAALGDSITANGSSYATEDGRTGSAWREFVAQELELADTIYNCGVGGSRVSGSTGNAMWEDDRIDAIPVDSDIIFFNGGMNDWRSNVALGTIDDTDTNTFYGALNTIVKKLYSRFATKLIVFMTTTFGVDKVAGNDYPESGLITNSKGLTTYDYAKCIKEVAERNGILCVDLYALCGWNKYNAAVYVNTEGDVETGNSWIHPNREGGKRITTAILSVLKNYQPYEEE
jgi:hypothetical protein